MNYYTHLKVSGDMKLNEALKVIAPTVLGEPLEREEKDMNIIFPLLVKPENDINNKWGKDYYWAAKQRDNMATFNGNRSGGRKHGARDLYTNPYEPVVAIAKGKVLSVSAFYMQTDQVTVLHETDDGRKFIVRYGELDPSSISVKIGDQVEQKQQIGKTGKLLRNNGKPLLEWNGTIVFMLHFEYYTGSVDHDLKTPLTVVTNKPFQRRIDLFDPLAILQEGYRNTFGENTSHTSGARVHPSSLSISDKGAKFIADWESVVKSNGKLYNDDAGYCTIGYGHLIKKSKCDGTEEQRFKNGLTDDEAIQIFKEDLRIFENEVKSKVKVNLYQHEFDALISFTFNVGGANLSSSTLLNLLNQSNYLSAAEEFNKWNKAGGVVMSGLTKRRNAEKEIFNNNVYDSSH